MHQTYPDLDAYRREVLSLCEEGRVDAICRNPLRFEDLRDFIACYNPENRRARKESDRFKSFAYEELMQRDKVNLDICWLRDQSLEESENFPEPDVIAAEITENLEVALEQFASICSKIASRTSE